MAYAPQTAPSGDEWIYSPSIFWIHVIHWTKNPIQAGAYAIRHYPDGSKIDPPLKPSTHNDPFFVCPCRGVLHTPHKCPWQWANESPTRYVSIEYVLIESFSQKGFDSPYPIESYTRQKFNSPLKHLTHNDPFSVYPCRGVLHTPHKCPWQWANESPTRYVSIEYVFVESFSRQEFDHTCRGVLHTPHKRPRQGTNESICHPFFEYT